MSCCICMEEDLPELEKFPCGHLVCRQCCGKLGFTYNLPPAKRVTDQEIREKGYLGIREEGIETIVIKSNVDSAEYMSNRRIKKVIIQEGVDTIGEKAFMDCYNIAEVVFPRSSSLLGLLLSLDVVSPR